MLRDYKGELFKKFALKLKKEGLWQKFIILEYYFRFYTNTSNGLLEIYEYIKNKNKDSVIPIQWFRNGKGLYGTYVEKDHIYDDDKDIKLSDFFKYYKV